MTKGVSLSLAGKAPGRLALGTWALGGGTDWGETAFQDFQEVWAAAYDGGVRLVDTSPIYGWGEAEERLGKIVQKNRHRVMIATKCGICRHNGRPDHDLSPRHIVQECEASLRRLRTDYIDIYQIHWPDPKNTAQAALEVLARLKEQGKIRSVGVCNFPPALLEEVRELSVVEWVQAPLSLLEPLPQETLSFCARNHIGFLGYGALGGGILSGKYSRCPNFRRCDARRYFYKYYYAQEYERVQKTVARVREIACQKQVPPVAVALAWAMQQLNDSVVLVGARNVCQMRQNLQSLSVVLTKQQQEFLRYG